MTIGERPVEDRSVSFAAVDHATADVKVVYILGSSRGGASIVGRVTGLMEGAVFGGELRRFWGAARQPGRMCGCGKTLGQCEVWSRMLKDGAGFLQPSADSIAALQQRVAPVRRSWLAALRILRHDGPPDAAAERYLAALTDLHRSFARTTGASIVVDSSKNAGDAALLAGSRDTSAFCVHVVRDPRSVVFSRRRDLADPARSRPWNAVRTGAYWMISHLIAEAIGRRYGDRYRLVRYESFVDDPSRTVAEIAHMVGGSPAMNIEPGTPIYVPPAHGPDGHGRFSNREFILRPDERWLRSLSMVDRTSTAVATLPLLRRYRYPIWTERLEGATA